MLLRRVIEHVREQNWIAIGIDFAIVVVGVYRSEERRVGKECLP